MSAQRTQPLPEVRLNGWLWRDSSTTREEYFGQYESGIALSSYLLCEIIINIIFLQMDMEIFSIANNHSSIF